MNLLDVNIPNKSTFIKLRDFPDGEIFTVICCGLTKEGQYGPQPYFVTDEDKRLMLPNRYVSYIQTILSDPEALEQLSKGVTLTKGSRAAANGGVTPTFTLQ